MTLSISVIQQSYSLAFGAELLPATTAKSPTPPLAGLLLLCLAALAGCHNRAYSDLYIENMSAEIRDLEDQLYEYDHEYRLLEQELAALRQQNGSLQQSPALNKPQTEYQTPTQPLEFYPRGSSEPIVPAPALTPGEFPSDGLAPQRNSILEPQDSPQTELVPPPSETANPESVTPAPAGETLPRSPFPSNDLPNPNAQDSGSFDLDALEMPEITPGEPMPPPMPVLTKSANGRSVAPEDDFELNLSRIEVPASLASRRRKLDGSAQGTIKPAIEKVTDQRVVELGFHPSLSRAANFDDRTDDDGLYLVLQPLNERGQMVAIAADLSILVIDPAKEGDAGHIGRWDYSAQEVKSKLQPIGANQGIHLTLPWNGPDPTADRVLVFARYTFPNGRQVIGEKTFFVASDDGLKSVWAPRAVTSKVMHAGFQGSLPTHSSPSNIVRPEPASAHSLPAPVPN